MSWTEAAWTVKKIEQDLQIPIFVNAYIARINELENTIKALDIPELEDIQNTINEITPLVESLKRSQQEIRINFAEEQAFFDTSISNDNTIIPTKHQDNTKIRKNTIWFILDVEQE